MKYLDVLSEEEKGELKKEPRITARALLEEVLPLLKESFVATVRLCEDGISMKFCNGQNAFLAVWFRE